LSAASLGCVQQKYHLKKMERAYQEKTIVAVPGGEDLWWWGTSVFFRLYVGSGSVHCFPKFFLVLIPSWLAPIQPSVVLLSSQVQRMDRIPVLREIVAVPIIRRQVWDWDCGYVYHKEARGESRHFD
jgi:hypothetical protein